MSKRLILSILLLTALCATVLFSAVTGSIRPQQGADLSVVPEYERGLEHVLLSIESRGRHLDAYEGLLRRLPGRTCVSVLVPEARLERVRSRFRSFAPRCRVEWIPFSEEPLKEDARAYLLFPEKRKLVDTGPVEDMQRFQGSAWAQDLFETAVDGRGNPVLLIPEVHKWFVCPDGNAPGEVMSDNRFLKALRSSGFVLRRAPLTFRGGNLLVDRFQGRRVAFCGGDVLRLTETVWRATRDEAFSAAEAEETLKMLLGVDEVVVIGGERPQPEHLFHLDQAVTFLGNGLVAVTRIVHKHGTPPRKRPEVSEVQGFLVELRGVLRDRGYRIVDMETSPRDLLGHRYAVNGIAFTEPGTTDRTFLMPVYASPGEDPASDQRVERNRAALERHGYRVVLVPTTADRNNGGLHCLAHVIE